MALDLQSILLPGKHPKCTMLTQFGKCWKMAWRIVNDTNAEKAESCAPFDEYAQYDGLGLAQLVRKKKVAPCELIEEAVRGIEQLNPKINAIIHRMYDLARQAAAGDLPDGPFRGVPFLLEDLMMAYAGVPLRRWHDHSPPAGAGKGSAHPRLLPSRYGAPNPNSAELGSLWPGKKECQIARESRIGV
jgi:hypothetical protein